MSRIWDWGEKYRPTPSSRGKKKPKYENVKGVDRERYIYCKICGFYVNKNRDSKCPFCETEMFDKDEIS